MAKKTNFRKFQTSSGKIVLAGRDSESNEELVKQAGQNELVLHTKARGSPFVNIKESEKETTKEEIKEAALFCAKYSHDWRDNKKDVQVHIFTGKDLFKEKGMAKGTFGVKKFQEIKVKKAEIESFEKLIKPKKT